MTQQESTPTPGGDADPGTQPEGPPDPSAGPISHALKNSLYAIVLQAEFAQTSLDQGDTTAAAKAMSRVRAATCEASTQLDDLLKLLRDKP